MTLKKIPKSYAEQTILLGNKLKNPPTFAYITTPFHTIRYARYLLFRGRADTALAARHNATRTTLNIFMLAQCYQVSQYLQNILKQRRHFLFTRAQSTAQKRSGWKTQSKLYARLMFQTTRDGKWKYICLPRRRYGISTQQQSLIPNLLYMLLTMFVFIKFRISLCARMKQSKLNYKV